ncbi:unnamed protein product, partial [Ectocarpus sp. 6 AP-2014]
TLLDRQRVTTATEVEGESGAEEAGAAIGPSPTLPRKKYPGAVHASFSHSLLRVVPYDDCPSLPYSDEGLSIATTSAATAMASASGGWPAPDSSSSTQALAGS